MKGTLLDERNAGRFSIDLSGLIQNVNFANFDICVYKKVNNIM